MPKQPRNTAEAGPRVKLENPSNAFDLTSSNERPTTVVSSSDVILNSHLLTHAALMELNRQNRANRPIHDSPPLISTPPDPKDKQLKRFARLGGPSLTDIRGYPRPSSIREENTAPEFTCPHGVRFRPTLALVTYRPREYEPEGESTSEANQGPSNLDIQRALISNAAHPGIFRAPDRSTRPWSHFINGAVDRLLGNERDSQEYRSTVIHYDDQLVEY